MGKSTDVTELSKVMEQVVDVVNQYGDLGFTPEESTQLEASARDTGLVTSECWRTMGESLVELAKVGELKNV